LQPSSPTQPALPFRHARPHRWCITDVGK
jgi:hypothetical protein